VALKSRYQDQCKACDGRTELEDVYCGFVVDEGEYILLRGTGLKSPDESGDMFNV
jgi:hypothetical protein